MGHVIDETANLLLKFPDRSSDLRRLYMASEKFRDLVRDFNDAAEALAFWRSAENGERQKEYEAVLLELEIAAADMLRWQAAADGTPAEPSAPKPLK